MSVKWATCNIGANSPEEYGWYFMWGDTTAYNSDRTPVEGGDAISFDWTNYPLCNGSSSTMKKYCTSPSYGTFDNKTILEPEDDAAYVHIGGECRMPTESEIQELIDACDTEWVTDYKGTGISGRLFTLKTDFSKKLFFPAPGIISGTIHTGVNSIGYIASSSLCTEIVTFSALYINSGICDVNKIIRSAGCQLRAVLPK